MIFSIIIVLLLVSCGKEESPVESISDHQIYEEVIDDFPRFVNSNGFVSSKWSDGSDEHEGEGILWSGVAMAFLPCHMGKGISKKMADLIVKNDGKVVRWLDDQGSLGEYADGREITMDGTTCL